jgi:hypothetical protein
VKIEGELEPGDLVLLQCSNRIYGGQSNAWGLARQMGSDRIEVVNGHKTVVEAEKPQIREIIAAIVRDVNAHWGGGITARQRNDNELVVQCETSVQNANFYYTIEGSKKQSVTIEDLA